MLYWFLLCLGIWLVVGFITFVRFIKKYEKEALEDSDYKLTMLCLMITLLGPISIWIIHQTEKLFKEWIDIDSTEKLNENG